MGGGEEVWALDYLQFKMLWGTISPGVMGHLPDRGVLPGGGKGKGRGLHLTEATERTNNLGIQKTNVTARLMRARKPEQFH